MKRKTKYIIILSVLLKSYFMIAQVSPFNQLKVHDSLQNYSFIVSGHFHGQSTNQSTFPAATLLANIDTLNNLKISFLMSLGDMFMDVDDVYLTHYKNALFNKINFPLFNAVGNHDISNGNRYEKEFGKSYFSFNIASELYIVLNTELNDGSIKGEQYSFLESVLKEAEGNKSIKNIFVLTHRPIWAERIDKYSKLFLENTRTAIGSNNFLEEVMPLLVPLKERNIIWMSGSMAGGPASFFYDKNEEVGITFIQTAIRDTPRDAMLVVNIKKGVVSFEGLSLTSQKLNSIESYDVDFWLKASKPEPEFSYRLIPLYLKNMILHRYFWYGSVFTFLLFILLRFTINRKRGR